MARAMVKLEQKGLPIHVTDPVRDFVNMVAAKQKAHIRTVMKGMLKRMSSKVAVSMMSVSV